MLADQMPFSAIYTRVQRVHEQRRGGDPPPLKFSNRRGQVAWSCLSPRDRVSPGSEFSPRSVRWTAACWRRMVDRPKWSTQSRSFRNALHSEGRPDPRHASRRGRALNVSNSNGADHAALLLQRNSVLVFHMAWRMTASLRATATRAFLKPELLASRKPQALRAEKATVRVSRVVAAS